MRKKNRFKLNLKKTEWLLLRGLFQGCKIDGVILSQKEQAGNLGASGLMDSAQRAGKGYGWKLWLVHQLWLYLEQDALMMVIALST